MTTPRRIQMTRRRPWRQDHPDAVIVARPTKWGNPFRIGQRVQLSADDPAAVCFSARQAVDAYRDFLEHPIGRRFRQNAVAELRGRDLACWCPLDQPCHADVLLDIANRTDGDDHDAG